MEKEFVSNHKPSEDAFDQERTQIIDSSDKKLVESKSKQFSRNNHKMRNEHTSQMKLQSSTFFLEHMAIGKNL